MERNRGVWSMDRSSPACVMNGLIAVAANVN
jgi:hypothetical protein